MDLADGPILSKESIRDFFRELLTRAIENQRASVPPFTELYLVNLLHEFLAAEALYVQADDGSWQQKPLAFLLRDALAEEGPAKVQMLRRLGDVSLFVSGFFPDSLARRSSLVDVDYYIAMGGRAYDAVARHAFERSLWNELSERDPDALVTQSRDWVASVCTVTGARDVSRVYDFGGGRRLLLPLVRRGSERSGLATESSMPIW